MFTAREAGQRVAGDLVPGIGDKQHDHHSGDLVEAAEADGIAEEAGHDDDGAVHVHQRVIAVGHQRRGIGGTPDVRLVARHEVAQGDGEQRRQRHPKDVLQLGLFAGESGAEDVEANVPDEERYEQADAMLDTVGALGGMVAPGVEQPGEHDARDEHVGERVPGRSPQG